MNKIREISYLHERDKPVSRLLAYGAGFLGTDELLAAVFGQNGQGLVDARALLAAFDGRLDVLAMATAEEMMTVAGIGPARVAQVKAALELGRRLLVAMPRERQHMRGPADVANMLMPEMSLLEQEELRVVLLDSRTRVIDVETVYVGSVNHAQVRVGEVFRSAIRRNAVAIMLVHNHPTGDPSPSPEDVGVTRSIVEAGRLLNIDVLDHLTIGRGRFISFRERGLGFA